MKLRLLARTSSLVRGAEAALFHRLEQIVHGLQPEGLHGVLVVGCDKNDVGKIDGLLAQPPDHSHPVQTGHMYVQEHHVRLQLENQVEGFKTVGTPCNYFNFRGILQEKSKLVTG